MKWILFFLLSMIIQNAIAQNDNGVKTIPVDSLKQYHIGVARDSNRIYIAKRGTIYSEDMSLWQKFKYFTKLVYDKYTILSWLFMILVVLWLVNLLIKLVRRS